MNYKKHYTSISDLPIWNWWKIAETGNLIYLHKDSDYSKTDYSLVSLWNKIQDEYLEEFGITEEFKRILKLKKKWIEKKADFILTGDRFILNSLDVIEADMKEEEGDKKPMKREYAIIVLEKKLGRELNERTLTVKKYFNYTTYLINNNA